MTPVRFAVICASVMWRFPAAEILQHVYRQGPRSSCPGPAARRPPCEGSPATCRRQRAPAPQSGCGAADSSVGASAWCHGCPVQEESARCACRCRESRDPRPGQAERSGCARDRVYRGCRIGLRAVRATPVYHQSCATPPATAAKWPRNRGGGAARRSPWHRTIDRRFPPRLHARGEAVPRGLRRPCDTPIRRGRRRG